MTDTEAPAASQAPSLAHIPFMALLGVRIESEGDGKAVLAVNLRPELRMGAGFFHGGVLAALFDHTAARVSLGTVRREENGSSYGYLTAEFKLNFLAPALGPTLVCRGELARPGRALCVVEGKLYDRAADGQERLVGIGLATMARFELGR